MRSKFDIYVFIFYSLIRHFAYPIYVLCFVKTFKLFGLERILWRFFQKRVMRTNFNIYVFITNNDITCIWTISDNPKIPQLCLWFKKKYILLLTSIFFFKIVFRENVRYEFWAYCHLKVPTNYINNIEYNNIHISTIYTKCPYIITNVSRYQKKGQKDKQWCTKYNTENVSYI